MSPFDPNPWESPPSDWHQWIHVLALEKSQHPDYAPLTELDVAGCVKRVVRRIIGEATGEEPMPPEPSATLVAVRLEMCLQDKLRARRLKASVQDELRDGDLVVPPDVSDPCTRCLQRQLNELRDRDPALWRLAQERWCEGKRKPAMTVAERKRLGRLEAQIIEVCQFWRDKWGCR